MTAPQSPPTPTVPLAVAEHQASLPPSDRIGDLGWPTRFVGEHVAHIADAPSQGEVDYRLIVAVYALRGRVEATGDDVTGPLMLAIEAHRSRWDAIGRAARSAS